MLNFYVKNREAVLRMTRDEDGVVSFEYIIVASCVVAAVLVAFGTDAGGNLATKLTTALNAILTKLPTS